MWIPPWPCPVSTISVHHRPADTGAVTRVRRLRGQPGRLPGAAERDPAGGPTPGARRHPEPDRMPEAGCEALAGEPTWPVPAGASRARPVGAGWDPAGRPRRHTASASHTASAAPSAARWAGTLTVGRMCWAWTRLLVVAATAIAACAAPLAVVGQTAAGATGARL